MLSISTSSRPLKGFEKLLADFQMHLEKLSDGPLSGPISVVHAACYFNENVSSIRHSATVPPPQDEIAADN
jgi:hypothetical protein